MRNFKASINYNVTKNTDKGREKVEIMNVQIMIGLQSEAEGIKDLPEKTRREMCGRQSPNSHHCPRKGLARHQQLHDCAELLKRKPRTQFVFP